jgi:hypothetical protein
MPMAENEKPDHEARLAAAFEPYLEAALAGEPSDDPDFDRDVLGVRDLAVFLARRAVEICKQARVNGINGARN